MEKKSSGLSWVVILVIVVASVFLTMFLTRDNIRIENGSSSISVSGSNSSSSSSVDYTVTVQAILDAQTDGVKDGRTMDNSGMPPRSADPNSGTVGNHAP